VIVFQIISMRPMPRIWLESDLGIRASMQCGMTKGISPVRKVVLPLPVLLTLL
jgi:hypothetical protein